MTITLTSAEIDAALPMIKKGLGHYLWLQAKRDACDLRADPEYRRKFNGFYKVRRGPAWQDRFYDLLERAKGTKPSFAEVLGALREATWRWEASFASKLVATVDPEQPVIDSVVLKNLGLKLPAHGSPNRAERTAHLHRTLVTFFSEFLPTENGRYLVRRFREAYPDADITETKMLDFVLWKTKPEKPATRPVPEQ